MDAALVVWLVGNYLEFLAGAVEGSGVRLEGGPVIPGAVGRSRALLAPEWMSGQIAEQLAGGIEPLA